jgi:site-specific recombinase XerD
MDSNYCLPRNVEDELRNSALAPHVDAYLAYLNRGRYAHNTVSQYLRCITHFARWVQQTKLGLNQVDEAAVERFLNKHLPHCHCSMPVVALARLQGPTTKVRRYRAPEALMQFLKTL